jgi:DNA-binding NtrC family response regulator
MIRPHDGVKMRAFTSYLNSVARRADNTFFPKGVSMTGTSLHASPLSSTTADDASPIQQIAKALAGAGLQVVRLDDLETAAMFNALAHCNNNRTKAARVLGISVRTLQRKLKSLERTQLS